MPFNRRSVRSVRSVRYIRPVRLSQAWSNLVKPNPATTPSPVKFLAIFDHNLNSQPSTFNVQQRPLTPLPPALDSRSQ
jgi:hypothetical protein